MSVLWKWLDGKNLTGERKNISFLTLNSLIFSALGLILWLLIGRFFLESWEWALCFAGYPGFFIGYIGGFIYLCRR